MPQWNARSAPLRDIEAAAHEILPFRHQPAARQLLAQLAAIYSDISDRRYSGPDDRRGPYLDHGLNSPIVGRLPTTKRAWKTQLWLTCKEFFTLVNMYRDHEVFTSRGGRPQAPASPQMAVFIYYVAHGNSYDQLTDKWTISGEN
jgi:hypothetical protein